MINRPIFLVLLVSLYSCATITSRRQLVSVDSSPRGQEIYLGERATKSIGVTPLFYELPRTKKLSLMLKMPGIPDKHFYEESCSFRWLVSGLGNIPFFIINPISGALALGYDFFSDNAWHCSDNIRVTWKSRKHLKACHRFFVVPPTHRSPSKAFHAYILWKKIVRKKIDKCHSFVGDAQIKKYHHILNLGVHSKFDYHKVSSHKINKIGYGTGADVFVTLNFDEKRKNILLADYYDMHTKSVIEGFPRSTKVQMKDHNEELASEVLSFTFELFPNSLAYESRSSFHDQDTFQENRRSNNSLPALLTSLSLLSIVSPVAYDDWDISYGFYPSLDFYSFDWSYSFEDSSKDGRWQLFYLMPSYEGRLMFFTGLGQVSLALGWGPQLSYSKYSGKSGEVIASSFSYNYLRYEAHMSQSVFFYLDTSNFSISKRIFATDELETGSFSEVALGLGYFFTNFSADIRWL